MPKVTAIANAPPSTTRIVARVLLASPARALKYPVIARATATAAKVIGMRKDGGGKVMASMGSTAPAKKDVPEPDAACQGYVGLPGSI